MDRRAVRLSLMTQFANPRLPAWCDSVSSVLTVGVLSIAVSGQGKGFN